MFSRIFLFVFSRLYLNRVARKNKKYENLVDLVTRKSLSKSGGDSVHFFNSLLRFNEPVLRSLVALAPLAEETMAAYSTQRGVTGAGRQAGQTL